jgi:hypothetical protein
MANSWGGAIACKVVGPWMPHWSQSVEIASLPSSELPLVRPVDRLGKVRGVRLSWESILFPHWLLMLSCALIGAAPWLRWRFSVRGMLVLMAFLAAMFAILIFE